MPRPEGPLDPDAGVVQRFAWELRQLRGKAGSPTYRELARRAHYSPATLAKAAEGRDLPSLAVTLAYVRACGGDPEQWETWWREVAAEAAPRGLEDLTEIQQADAPAPYVGLAVFSPGDADRFFGREQLVAELVAKLAQHRFLVVAGASGSGKSSLLRAGLLPAVRGECATVLITPGAEPLSRLHQALDARPPQTEQTDVLLVVDQFEELFTLCPDLTVRERFITGLLEAVREPGSRTRVVVGVRADFYTHCAQHRGLVAVLREAQVLVGPLSTDELRAVITGPAVRFGYSVEGALVSRLIGEATGQPGVLPLLSHVLLETWRRRRGNALTLAGYDAAGGIHRAIARTAEQAYASLNDQQQQLARHILLRLVALGEGTEDTKRRISRSELDHDNPDDNPDIAAVVDTLARARLLTVDATGVEIAHEALIRSWPRLRDWLTEDRDGLRIHRQLTDAAAAWESLDRDPGALYRGTRLDLARDWAATPAHHGRLNTLEQAFLDASNHAARRRTRHLKQVIALLATLLVLALTASAVAIHQRQIALDQHRSALARKLIAQSATLAAAGQPEASMLLAVEAFHQYPTLTEARSALLSSQSQYFTARLTGHTDAVTDVALSPDGRTLATTSDDETVRLWDVTSHKEITTFTGHTGQVTDVAFSPDGRTLATTGWDRTVRLWDVINHEEITKFTGHTDVTVGVAFSSDGRALAATTSDRRIVRLWDVIGHKVIATFTGHSERVTGVAFSPDGRTLATTGWDRTVRLWDVINHEEITKFTGHTDVADGVAFSSDGRALAATTSDGMTVRLWDVIGHKVIATFTGHSERVTGVAFSPDGRTLATTSSSDGTIRLWNVAGRNVTATMIGHTDVITSVVFSPDGQTLATAGSDNTAVLWRTNGPILIPYPITPNPVDPVTVTSGAEFSADGRTLATLGDDGMVRLWDATSHKLTATMTDNTAFTMAFSPDGRTLATVGPATAIVTSTTESAVRLWDVAGHKVTALTGHSAPVNGVAFSPDGRTLAIVDAKGTTRLWDIAGRNVIATMTKNTAFTMAFSPDGRTLAIVDAVGTIRLWDIAGRHVTDTMPNNTSPVTRVRFSPDSRMLATVGDDEIVRLWHVASHKMIADFTGQAAHLVNEVAFSPDSRTLATVGDDKTVRLWDVASHKVIATLTGHTREVTAVTFSPDGRTLVTTSRDGTIRFWDPDPARVAAHNCQLIGTITRARWEQLMPELPYRPTCT